ncbi:MAG: hypothetical protein Q8O67_01975 [Deltaproteobacteria bacterium]|nr:hypothetical protein [Deltaproteobacteria bacterium]
MPRPVGAGFQWGAGDVVLPLVDVKTFYVEFAPTPPPTGSPFGPLVMHSELNGNLSDASGERLDIVKTAYDFQVAVGYARPGSGRVAREVLGGESNDDWRYNAESENTSPLQPDDLAMVGASTVVGLHQSSAPAAVVQAAWNSVGVSVADGTKALAAGGRVAVRSRSPRGDQ